ncbi:cytochrome C, partial [Desulfoprunum benzoelyticum]|nr:cytochrome C [Desulfoprunum benzoelyticum]MBM9531710.1 cytochrome C [Desulfoprunum benzoelyticum]
MSVVGLLAMAIIGYAGGVSAGDPCVDCHTTISPGQVKDWQVSKHSGNDVTCSTCHGDKHMKAEDAALAQMPDEKVCAECHEEQFNQFASGKHNYGWTSLNAIPATHLAPDELIEGGRG